MTVKMRLHQAQPFLHFRSLLIVEHQQGIAIIISNYGVAGVKLVCTLNQIVERGIVAFHPLHQRFHIQHFRLSHIRSGIRCLPARISRHHHCGKKRSHKYIL